MAHVARCSQAGSGGSVRIPRHGLESRALGSVDTAIRVAQSLRDSLRENPERCHQLQRILSYLHFIRTALLDRDAPFYAG